MASRTLITIATYNELENLPSLVAEIHARVPQTDILVIDDNSPDGTGDWCEQAAAEDSRIHLLRRSGKLGLGTAIVAGMRFAIENGYTNVLNMDADFSHHPRFISDLLSPMEADGELRTDVAIGSRYIPGGGILGWPIRRQLMSRGVNFYARLLLGLKTRDCSGGFRCYRTEFLTRIDLQNMRSWGYSFQEEILWRLHREGARLLEVPITFTDRERGQSKINATESFAALWIILRLGMTNWLGW